jgi:hypothetical protein
MFLQKYGSNTLGPHYICAIHFNKSPKFYHFKSSFSNLGTCILVRISAGGGAPLDRLEAGLCGVRCRRARGVGMLHGG